MVAVLRSVFFGGALPKENEQPKGQPPLVTHTHPSRNSLHPRPPPLRASPVEKGFLVYTNMAYFFGMVALLFFSVTQGRIASEWYIRSMPAINGEGS